MTDNMKKLRKKKKPYVGQLIFFDRGKNGSPIWVPGIIAEIRDVSYDNTPRYKIWWLFNPSHREEQESWWDNEEIKAGYWSCCGNRLNKRLWRL